MAECPTIPATVIAKRIGLTHSIRLLRDRVAEVRPVYLPPDLPHAHPSQCDFWFPEIELSVTTAKTDGAATGTCGP